MFIMLRCFAGLGPFVSNVYQGVCTFHSSSIILNKYAVREGRMMRKLLNQSSSKRKSWHTPNNIHDRTSMPTQSSIIHQGGCNNRRVAVLNKLFMRHITDLMATGEIASEILQRGIEISRVKVTSDFTRVNVYWLAKGSKHNEDTEDILSKCSGKLRHELSQLRLIGSVPIIEFVKDKNYSKLVDVDHLLAVADFGENYVPVDPSYHLKSEFILNMHFTQTVKGCLEMSHEPNHLDELPLPSMRMDVLGVNQLDIMTKVRKSLKKSEAPHRAGAGTEPTVGTDHWSTQSEETKHINVNITDFFIKQQQQKRKTLRGVKNYQPEFELHENEWQSNNVSLEFLKDVVEEDDFDEIFDTEDDNR